MRRRVILAVVLIGLALALLGGGQGVKAGDGYLLERSVIAGGGGSLSAGSYTLDGTVGQAETSVLSAGSYQLYGGFWHTALVQYKVDLPVVIR